MKTKVLTARVPSPLADRIDEMSRRLGQSPGWIVKQALTAWVDQEEERHRLTSEALTDVDKRRIIDHQAVQAWADALSTDETTPAPRRWG